MEGTGAARGIRIAVLAASDPCGVVRRWKTLSGRKAVGCPSFFPVPEILHAVCMLPVFPGTGEESRPLAALMDEWARVPDPLPEGIVGTLDWVESVAEWAEGASGETCSYGALERSMRFYRERYALVRRLEARCAGPGALLEAATLQAVVESGRFLTVETHSMLLEGILGKGDPADSTENTDREDPLLHLARRVLVEKESRKAFGAERRYAP